MTKPRIKISPTFPILLAFLAFCGSPTIALGTILAALLHECGHLAAARLLKIPIGELRLDLLGARLRVTGKPLGYGDDFLLSAAGPLFSFLASLAAAPLWGTHPFFRIFSCVSLLLGGLNLLPLPSFDGGRMLEDTLGALFPVRSSGALAGGIEVGFLALFFSSASYLLLRSGSGISLFCFSVGLFSRFGTKIGGKYS